MRIRRKIIDFSRGNDLSFFWRIRKLQNKVRSEFLKDILTFISSRNAYRHGGYIGPDTIIEEEPELPHGLCGIFISRYAKIGRGCRIYQNVTIGEVNKKAPSIGDGCLIGAGAVIVGGVKIGKGAKIGAGAVVATDVPDGCTVVSPGMRILEGKENGNDKI